MKKKPSKKELVYSVKIRSIKDNFRKDLIPNTGSIFIQERKPNSHEMNMSEWILKEFGGDITFLRERGDEGIKTPDATWSGIELEIKKASGTSSVNNRVRTAVNQLSEKGIILLDISENEKNIEVLKQEATRRVVRSLVEDDVKIRHVYIIFMKKKQLMDILEIKERGR